MLLTVFQYALQSGCSYFATSPEVCDMKVHGTISAWPTKPPAATHSAASFLVLTGH